MFSYFLSDDPEEQERCKLVGRFNTANINPLAYKYIQKTGATNMCEYHHVVTKLENKIDYEAENHTQ